MGAVGGWGGGREANLKLITSHVRGRGCRETELGYQLLGKCLLQELGDWFQPQLSPAPCNFEVTQLSHVQNGFMLELFLKSL